MAEIKPDEMLDVRDRVCPYPMILTMRKVKEMKPGEVLKVISNTEGIKTDLPAWCEKTSNQLLHQEEKAGETIFYVKKG